jgi:protein-disulfide isomerase
MIVYKEDDNTKGHGNKKKTLLIIFATMGSIFTGAILLASYGLGQVAAQQAGNNNNNTKLSPAALRQQGVPLLGTPSAPVTIIEFGDFQCPFCDRFAKDTEPQINQTYIQTGKVNMFFLHFTIYGPDSITAAVAAQCVNDQGKFWNLYDILYKNQGAENSGWANKDNLKKFASQIPGLDTGKFNSCLDSGKYLSLVQNDLAFASSLGLQGTPAFIIEKRDGSNPELLPGAYPFPAFQALINKKLTGG